LIYDILNIMHIRLTIIYEYLGKFQTKLYTYLLE